MIQASIAQIVLVPHPARAAAPFTLAQMLPPETDIASAYEQSRNADDQNLIANLCMYLTTFLLEHSDLVETVCCAAAAPPPPTSRSPRATSR